MTIYRLDGRVEPHPLGHVPWMDAITSASTHDLDEPASRARILDAGGLMISSGADHLQLARHTDALTDFVGRGGRVLVNAQIAVPFIHGQARWSRLNYRSAGELRPHQVTAHPVWDGVDYLDLHFRKGHAGTFRPQAELVGSGVAGFYGRGYHVDLPSDSTVITGIGPLRLPLDYSFRIGDGEVVVHAGRDLDKYADPAYSTGRFAENLTSWLNRRTTTSTGGVQS